MQMSFRYKLSNAINNIRSWDDRRRSDIELLDQVTSVIRLAHTYGLSISVVKVARRDDAASYDYNCFMWAFGLPDWDWLSIPAADRQRVYPRSDFAESLIHHYLREISQQETRTGDLVVYFNDGNPVHAGTWESGLVTSKWGIYSHLWKHGPCELPIEYGEEIRFYRRSPRKNIMEFYKKWFHHQPPPEKLLDTRIRKTFPPKTCSGRQRYFSRHY
jgi:hypothetical protein